ncbi:MAG TPA: hypothetical protein VM619_06675 [Luteimonas sp.]|nr:hypothetical protein [Luteimonas sp.]
MAVLAILVGLLPHSVAQAGTPVKKAWEWRGEPARDRRIAIDLIRADVSITVAAGLPTVRIMREAPAAGTVSFTASTDGDSVEILDRYPIRAMRLRDCLPPIDAGRGDYWSHPVKLRVAVSIPAGTALRVRVRSGNITADASAKDLDLHTGDGAVTRPVRLAPTDG